MFSQLLRFKVVDKLQNWAKVMDFSVALLDDDYPPVTDLFFLDDEKNLKRLKWEAVDEIDLKHRRIITQDLKAAEEVSSILPGEVLINFFLDIMISFLYR